MHDSQLTPQTLKSERIAGLNSAMEMPAAELENLVALAEALWVDERVVGHHLYEAYVASVLTERDPVAQVIKVAHALLLRAGREARRGDGVELNTNSMDPKDRDAAFFKLEPLERALLAVSHSQRWSYEKLAKVFQLDRETLEERLWSARLNLLSEAQAFDKQGMSILGGPKRGMHCPEYQKSRPWTQRFLDGEISNARERAFLQNHLMACSGCQKALYSARDLYYRVDHLIPKSKLSADFSAQLSDVSKQTLRMALPGKMTFWESMNTFSRRLEVRIVLGAMGLLILYSLFSSN